jgi:hypothetical protein
MACTAPAGVPPRADRDPWLEDGPPPAADSAPAEALSARCWEVGRSARSRVPFAPSPDRRMSLSRFSHGPFRKA